MADKPHQRHDALFRAVYSEVAEAASLLREAVPREVSESIDWNSLRRVQGSFVDEELRRSETPADVQGTTMSRIVQLLMMAAFGRHTDAALDATAELTVSLRPGSVAERIQIIFCYLHAMQDQATVDAFAEALRQHGDRQGGGVMTQMTYIERVLEEGLEQGREEGREEGREQGLEQGLEKGREEGLEKGREEGLEKGREEGVQRTKVEVVDGLLKQGVQWDVITPATGIDESRFRALKERLTVAAQGDEPA